MEKLNAKMKLLPRVNWRSWALLSFALLPLSFLLFIIDLVNAVKTIGDNYAPNLLSELTNLLISGYFFIGTIFGPLVGKIFILTTDNAAGLIWSISLCLIQSCFWSYLFLIAKRRLTKARSTL